MDAPSSAIPMVYFLDPMELACKHKTDCRLYKNDFASENLCVYACLHTHFIDLREYQQNRTTASRPQYKLCIRICAHCNYSITRTLWYCYWKRGQKLQMLHTHMCMSAELLSITLVGYLPNGTTHKRSHQNHLAAKFISRITYKQSSESTIARQTFQIK